MNSWQSVLVLRTVAIWDFPHHNQRGVVVLPLRLLLIPVLVQLCGAAQPAERPPCNAKNHGAIWRDENAQTGCNQIQVCTLNVWRYRWEAATVPISQLSKDSRRRTVCETTPESAATRAHTAQAREAGQSR